MQRIFFHLALLFLIVFSGCERFFNGRDTVQVECYSERAQSAFVDHAVLYGSYTVAAGKFKSLEAFFYYSSDYSDTDSLLAYGMRADAGKFSENEKTFRADLSGLTPLTNYYYVAAVDVDGTVFYGEPVHFFTGFYSISVETKAANRVLSHSACLKGTMVCSQLSDLKDVEAGFYLCKDYHSEDYVKESGSYVPGRIVLPWTGDGNYFVGDLRGYELKANTKYCYIACMRVSNSVFYGDMLTFTTQPDPNPDRFEGKIIIDGDFSDWVGLYAETADGMYSIYEDSNDGSCYGLPRVKLTSDEDYIYLYADIETEYLLKVENGISDTDTPGTFAIYIDYDGDDNGSVIDYEGQPLWDYSGFDTTLRYNIYYDSLSNQGQAMGGVSSGESIRLSGWEYCPLPPNIGSTLLSTVRMELSIDRRKIVLKDGESPDSIKMAVCYYSPSDSVCCGRLPSDRSVITLALR